MFKFLKRSKKDPVLYVLKIAPEIFNCSKKQYTKVLMDNRLENCLSLMPSNVTSDFDREDILELVSSNWGCEIKPPLEIIDELIMGSDGCCGTSYGSTTVLVNEKGYSKLTRNKNIRLLSNQLGEMTDIFPEIIEIVYQRQYRGTVNSAIRLGLLHNRCSCCDCPISSVIKYSDGRCLRGGGVIVGDFEDLKRKVEDAVVNNQPPLRKSTVNRDDIFGDNVSEVLLDDEF